MKGALPSGMWLRRSAVNTLLLLHPTDMPFLDIGKFSGHVTFCRMTFKDPLKVSTMGSPDFKGLCLTRTRWGTISVGVL